MKNPLSYVRLTLPQVAQRLGVSEPRARALVVRGPLEGMRINGRIFVEAAQLDRFARNNQDRR